ncbi:MAG: hypothetical protein KDD44_09540, partial [Bdellovibrionales bacterium]|nr:hypothetical protein [Bdellovibrionales bacterium]
MSNLLLLIPILPLIGSMLVYILTARSERLHGLSGWIATAAAFASFGVTTKLFLSLEHGHDIAATLWTWFAVDPIKIDFA